MEEKEATGRARHALSNSDTVGNSESSPEIETGLRKEKVHSFDGSVSDLGQRKSSASGSVPSESGQTPTFNPIKPKRTSVLFVDLNNTGQFTHHLSRYHACMVGTSLDFKKLRVV
jgi:hypothetical protein